VGTEDEVADA